MQWKKTEQTPYRAAEWPPCSGCGRRVPTVTTPNEEDKYERFVLPTYHIQWMYPSLCLKCLSEAIATLSE